MNQNKVKSFIVLPDDLAWIDLKNKIALKQTLIKTEQIKLPFKLYGTVQRTSVQTKLVLCTIWPIYTMLFYYVKMPASSSP